jgi:salicylate hydroxylase
VVASRTIIIAGAGIGGLTAALAVARRGFRVLILEQAAQLQETGAGLQLSPNAARVLIDLGLEERLKANVVAPRAIRVRDASNGRDITRLPVAHAEKYYGAPYWVIHRADLQAALLSAVGERPEIEVRLGKGVEEFAAQQNRITVTYSSGGKTEDATGIGLIGADGLWSAVRACLWGVAEPRLAGRTAWRALVSTERVPAEFREPIVHLWIGPDGHIVVYPVRRGHALNIVAITTDSFAGRSWSTGSGRDDLLSRFPTRRWTKQAIDLLAAPEGWLKWALYDRPPLPRWGRGAVTLLGDAAHPMVPFLAQGAAMAIEDAAVLADVLVSGTDIAAALRRYEVRRRPRTTRVQQAALTNGRIYHLSGPAAALRNVTMRFVLGNELVLSRYDWIYEWRPPSLTAPTPTTAVT